MEELYVNIHNYDSLSFTIIFYYLIWVFLTGDVSGRWQSLYTVLLQRISIFPQICTHFGVQNSNLKNFNGPPTCIPDKLHLSKFSFHNHFHSKPQNSYSLKWNKIKWKATTGKNLGHLLMKDMQLFQESYSTLSCVHLCCSFIIFFYSLKGNKIETNKKPFSLRIRVPKVLLVSNKRLHYNLL